MLTITAAAMAGPDRDGDFKVGLEYNLKLDEPVEFSMSSSGNGVEMEGVCEVEITAILLDQSGAMIGSAGPDRKELNDNPMDAMVDRMGGFQTFTLGSDGGLFEMGNLFDQKFYLSFPGAFDIDEEQRFSLEACAQSLKRASMRVLECDLRSDPVLARIKGKWEVGTLIEVDQLALNIDEPDDDGDSRVNVTIRARNLGMNPIHSVDLDIRVEGDVDEDGDEIEHDNRSSLDFLAAKGQEVLECGLYVSADRIDQTQLIVTVTARVIADSFRASAPIRVEISDTENQVVGGGLSGLLNALNGLPEDEEDEESLDDLGSQTHQRLDQKVRSLIKRGDVDRVRTMLKEGLDPSLTYKIRITELYNEDTARAQKLFGLEGRGSILVDEERLAEVYGDEPSKFDVLAEWDEQGSILGYACKDASFAEIALMLLERGADPNAQQSMATTLDPELSSENSMGWALPIHLAAKAGSLEVVQQLVAAGADPAAVDSQGLDAVFYALNGQHDECAAWLLQQGASGRSIPGGDPLVALAARNNCLSTLALLCQRPDTDPDHPGLEGWTALKYAAKEGFVTAVRILLAGGATVDIQDNEGWSALMNAANEGNHRIVRYLLAAGADPTLRNRDGQRVAALVNTKIKEGESSEEISNLQRILALVRQAEQRGPTEPPQRPTIPARYQVEAVALAPERKSPPLPPQSTPPEDIPSAPPPAPPTAPPPSQEAHEPKEPAEPTSSDDSCVPLLQAYQKGDLEVIRGHLRTPAAALTPLSCGASPLQLAIAVGNEAAYRLLRQLVNEGSRQEDRINKEGDPPIVAAVKAGDHREVVRLLEAGCDPARPDRSGITAFEHAWIIGHDRIFNTLLQAGVQRIPGLEGEENAPLEWAVRAARAGASATLWELIRKQGVPPDQPSQTGELILLEGLYHPGLVRILLRLGADPTRPGRDGLNAIQIAEQRGLTTTLAALRESSSGA